MTTTVFEQVQTLYFQGQYLRAYESSQADGPLASWTGPDARVLAGRLAANLGALRLAQVLHWRAYRDSPQHIDARYFYLLSLATRRGAWSTWQWLRKFGRPPDATLEQLADWLALEAHILALFRDFSRAEETLREALAAAPDRPWLWVVQGGVLQMADRHEEGLESLRHALELRPWYRPGVQSLSHALVQANRTDEAHDLLTRACEQLQSGDTLAQLAGLQTELEQYDAARRNWERLIDYYPLIRYEKFRQQWLHARLSDAAYFCGDFAAAADWAEKSKLPFFTAMVDRLRAPAATHRRVVLPVGFVRQHHMTCAPATLSAISQFWSRPAEHLHVAEEICYDGTPAHSERKWADDQGFIAREFRVEWDTAVALIDAGIPFTLTTVEPGNAHLQAVIGYDQARGTLLVRDPGERSLGEFRGAEMIKHYRSTGPRGMLIAPPEKANSLAGIPLPDADFYDDSYQLELALRRHDREAAAAVLQKMEAANPQHRLTHYAGRSLARYDADVFRALACIDRLRADYPDDVNLILSKISCLHELGRRDERLQLLHAAHRLPEAHWLFTLYYARELRDDARETEHVSHLARRTLRARGADATACELLAGIEWDRQQYAVAAELYRFAASLENMDESRARSYFVALRHLKQTDVGLEFLRERVRRYDRQSTFPVRTLASAFEQLDRSDQAVGLVEETLRDHPDDGDFTLYAARFFLGCGQRARAQELLEHARPRSARMAWLRTAAALARAQGDFVDALRLWREVLDAEPLAQDANEVLPALISSVEGEEAALAHVIRQAQRFPHHYTIRVVRSEWASRQGSAVAERTLRQMLEIYPVDPWARRELAIALIGSRKWSEALVETRLAEELDPTTPIISWLFGQIEEGHGRLAAAREHYRRALRKSVDYIPAMTELLRVCESKQERVAALRFIQQELVRQVTFGDGLFQFRLYAEGTLDETETLTLLQDAHRERPDLWQSWSTLIAQQLSCGNINEAQALADRAVERFPLLPRLWLDRADVCDKLCQDEEQIASVQKALEINPGWGTAERRLAELYQRAARFDESRAALERAIRHEPLESHNHVALAEFLWSRNERDAAIERARLAIDIEPGDERAWSDLDIWSREMKQPELAVEAARRLTVTRPHEARSWLFWSRMLDQPYDRAARIAALDVVLKLNPRHEEAHGRRAYTLAEEGRFDEALAACAPAVFGDAPPLLLRARAAQIRALQGDLPAAVEQMKAVVADDPEYNWAWSQLADWYDRLGENENYLEAARQLVRITPDTPVSFGYLGDALARTNQRDAAKEQFVRAIRIAPDYYYGARYAAELALEDNQPAIVAEILDIAGGAMPAGYAQAYAIQRLRLLGESQEIPARLEQLLAEPLPDFEPVQIALRKLEDLPVSAGVSGILSQHFTKPDCAPELGEVWGQLMLRQSRAHEFRAQLKLLQCEPDIWSHAAAAYVEYLADKLAGHELRSFVNRNSKRLRANHRSWSAVGYGLSQIDDRPAVIRWLSDWNDRPEVKAVDLFYLALALRNRRKTDRAAPLNRYSLKLPPDNSLPYHKLWLAVDAALAGSDDEARNWMSQVAGTNWNDFYSAIFKMVSILLPAETQDNGSPPVAYAELDRQLADVAMQQPQDGFIGRLTRQFRVQFAYRHNRPWRAKWIWLGGG